MIVFTFVILCLAIYCSQTDPPPPCRVLLCILILSIKVCVCTNYGLLFWYLLVNFPWNCWQVLPLVFVCQSVHGLYCFCAMQFWPAWQLRMCMYVHVHMLKLNCCIPVVVHLTGFDNTTEAITGHSVPSIKLQINLKEEFNSFWKWVKLIFGFTTVARASIANKLPGP